MAFSEYMNFMEMIGNRRKMIDSGWILVKKQRDRRQTALLQHQNFRFSLSFGLAWLLYTKLAQYNEGCAKLNYSLPEV